MAVLNYSGEELNAKIVYYGPGLSGKTTNLEYIHETMPVRAKGKLVSMKTRTDRTLFFDFLPLELGEINGYRTRFLLYTVPGQVYYNATRKLVLKGVDAVVFVADSSRSKLHENIESLRNLEENLNEHGLSLDHIPWVIQYNKRDVDDAMPLQELHEALNLLGVPAFEGVATAGTGVYETFQGIAGLLYNRLRSTLERAGGTAAAVADRAEPAGAGAGEPDVLSDAVDSALREVGGSKGLPGAGTAAPAESRLKPERPPVTPPDAPDSAGELRAQSVGSPAGVRASGQPPASARGIDRPLADAGASPSSANLPTAESTATGTVVEATETNAGDPTRQFEAIPDEHTSAADMSSMARIEEAAKASEVARRQAQPEFIIDPIGGATSAPANEPQETDGQPAEPVSQPEPFELTVPILIPASKAVHRAGFRVHLDIQFIDE